MFQVQGVYDHCRAWYVAESTSHSTEHGIPKHLGLSPARPATFMLHFLHAVDKSFSSRQILSREIWHALEMHLDEPDTSTSKCWIDEMNLTRLFIRYGFGANDAMYLVNLYVSSDHFCCSLAHFNYLLKIFQIFLEHGAHLNPLPGSNKVLFYKNVILFHKRNCGIGATRFP